MELLTQRLASLLTVKSLVTVILTAVFAAMAGTGRVTAEQVLDRVHRGDRFLLWHAGGKAGQGMSVGDIQPCPGGGQAAVPPLPGAGVRLPGRGRPGEDRHGSGGAAGADPHCRLRGGDRQQRVPHRFYNQKVGGARASQHLLGRAADIQVSGASPLLVGQIAEYYLGGHGGIGVYQTFTHVDTRTARARWDQRSGREVAVSGWPGWRPKEETIMDNIPSAYAEEAVAWAVENGLCRAARRGT